VAFLTARYDERQYAAEAAERTGRWEDLAWPGSYGIIEVVATEHILAWSPKFVLADIASKRALIQLAFRYAADFDRRSGCGHTVEQIATGACPFVGEMESMDLLRMLAAPYAEHPDYQREWAVA
jgi:hypothetical protein